MDPIRVELCAASVAWTHTTAYLLLSTCFTRIQNEIGKGCFDWDL